MSEAGDRFGEREWSKDEQLAESAAQEFTNSHDVAVAVAFLRANPESITAFCLSVQDCYSKTDVTTIVLKLAQVMEELVKG